MLLQLRGKRHYNQYFCSSSSSSSNSVKLSAALLVGSCSGRLS